MFRLVKTVLIVAGLLIWSSGSQFALAQESGLSGIVPEGAVAEQVVTGFQFTEGPAIDPEGNLFFTDVRRGEINIWTVTEELVNFRTDLEAKANGLMFDAEGRLVACEGGKGQVTRTELDGSITVLADEFGGSRFNSPNDLIIAADGSVYFTDPFWGQDSPQPLNGVYRIAPDGVVTLEVDDMFRPNGVFLSEDQQTLYVANDGAQVIRAYAVEADGEVADGRDFAAMSGITDGMTLDAEGNLYVAGGTYDPASKGVWVFDSTGVNLGVIAMPEMPTNCTFSGNTLYVTAGTSVYSIELMVAGLGFNPAAVGETTWGKIKKEHAEE